MALRVFIEIDLKKPISRGRTINVLGKKLWIALTFDKLSRIYFGCGKIIHGERSCKEMRGSLSSSSGQYGPRLREAFGNKIGKKQSNFGSQSNNSHGGPKHEGDQKGTTMEESTDHDEILDRLEA